MSPFDLESLREASASPRQELWGLAQVACLYTAQGFDYVGRH